MNALNSDAIDHGKQLSQSIRDHVTHPHSSIRYSRVIYVNAHGFSYSFQHQTHSATYPITTSVAKPALIAIIGSNSLASVGITDKPARYSVNSISMLLGLYRLLSRAVFLLKQNLKHPLTDQICMLVRSKTARL